MFKMTNLVLKYCCSGKFRTYNVKSLAVGIMNIWVHNHNPSLHTNHLYLALTMCQTPLEALNTYHPFSSLTQSRRHALLLGLMDKWGNFRIPDSLSCPGTHSESVGTLGFKPRNSHPRAKHYYEWGLRSNKITPKFIVHICKMGIKVISLALGDLRLAVWNLSTSCSRLWSCVELFQDKHVGGGNWEDMTTRWPAS